MVYTVSGITLHRLRRKIEDNHSSPDYLHTVRGVGYRFTKI